MEQREPATRPRQRSGKLSGTAEQCRLELGQTNQRCAGEETIFVLANQVKLREVQDHLEAKIRALLTKAQALPETQCGLEAGWTNVQHLIGIA